MASPITWDLEWELGKLVIGIVILSLCLWPVIWGIGRMWFISKEGLTLKSVDLNKGIKEPLRGNLQVTGYPGIQISVDSYNAVYMENLAEAAKTYKNFYFSLHSQQKNSPALVIVQRKETFASGLFGYFFSSQREKFPLAPEKNKQITVTGIAGYHISSLGKTIKQYFEAEGVNVADTAILLEEGVSIPSYKNTLPWFIPVLLIFLFGGYLIARWLLLLKAGY
ncbi:hypothetical protein J4207_04485 [Candidatus Woesearchaeota archaeon]|nr:hypothetical protein [Candidatus Woesearchaeota archaeon]HLC80712.1 hypothetical protein [Candidatus Nanoarchaeia archaeon]